MSSDPRLSDISMIYLQYVHSESNVDVSYQNVSQRNERFENARKRENV